MKEICKKAVAESVGTFILVFVACGVAAITGGSIVATSLAFGFTFIAMAYTIGRVSGCHINPAVSLGCLIAKRITVKDIFVYIISQVVGGILGAIAIFGIFRMAGVDPLGNACNYCVGYSRNGYAAGGIIGALIAEILLTDIFVYTVLNVTDETSGTGKIAGIVIGLVLAAVHLVGINLTGTSVNPARSLATAISDAIYNQSTEPLAQVWMFVVAPLVGGFLGAIMFKTLNMKGNNVERVGSDR